MALRIGVPSQYLKPGMSVDGHIIDSIEKREDGCLTYYLIYMTDDYMCCGHADKLIYVDDPAATGDSHVK